MEESCTDQYSYLDAVWYICGVFQHLPCVSSCLRIEKDVDGWGAVGWVVGQPNLSV